MHLCKATLLALLTEKLLCLTGIVARCTEEAGCSWVGTTAGITAGSTVGAAKYVTVGGWIATRWAWNGARVGVEVVGVEIVWGDNYLLLVGLVMKVANVILKRFVGMEL